MRRYFRRSHKVRAEVNLTPLIDVMMSLLAIFMITAPLLTSGIPLTLPRGDGKNIEGSDKTLDIGITRKGEIYVGENRTTMAQLATQVGAIVSENPHIKIMISGDAKADYGKVIEVMALLRAKGFQQVGLKTGAKVVQED